MNFGGMEMGEYRSAAQLYEDPAAVYSMGYEDHPERARWGPGQRNYCILHYVTRGKGLFNGREVHAGQGFYIHAGQMHECIRECLREMYKDKADEIPLMYGGSVNSENAPGLLAQLQIDGLGIGRSAWNAAEFDAIMRCACTGSK
jgi:hypothetical protein